MPEAVPIIKKTLSVIAIPGTFMVMMGLGFLPVDEKMTKIAAPFIAPLGIPFQPFVACLGTCKVLAGLSMWGIGPMSDIVARIGLMLCTSCAAYGHHVVGDNVIPPIVYFGLVSSLFVLDKYKSTKEKKV
eukprot:CAMPEP_0171318478 /NCGR_PEP_ID=MMETSP0816-20121228/88952_1 /TAXON_ID=420281 /ORGANISM="Proboscia inermis, Strain CCAP1064/1" /LENGTH=129 /DNA_ID=CAMNT_0011813039 /DNA_START=24 /DNA_END=413 /DNA_ORIENTATION=-